MHTEFWLIEKRQIGRLRRRWEDVIKMAMVVFWIMAPCSIVGGYKVFEGTYHLHLQG
jgi:hypothetical protein